MTILEPRKFFVKDFIKYATPCFGCGKPNNFCFSFTEKGGSSVSSKFPLPVINDRYVEVELNVKYASNLKLFIFHKDNKILSSDGPALSNFVAKRNLYLQSYCVSCGTQIFSSPLDLQLFNSVVAPTTLAYEYLEIRHGNKLYTLESHFNAGEGSNSLGTVLKFGPNGSSSKINFVLPLLPKYKLRDQQHLIDKLNTYAIFS